MAKLYTVLYMPIPMRKYAKNWQNIEQAKKQMSTDSNTALAQWLEFWLSNVNYIKDTTKQIYKGHLENHIIPNIGEMR